MNRSLWLSSFWALAVAGCGNEVITENTSATGTTGSNTGGSAETSTTSGVGGSGVGGSGVGGSGGAGGAPEILKWHGGTRLQLQFYRGDDGATEAIELRDTQLDVPCTFVTATDGSPRCMPGGQQVVFLDAGCTQAAIRTFSGDQLAGTFASSTIDPTEGCYLDAQTVIYRVDPSAATMGNVSGTYGGQPGKCYNFGMPSANAQFLPVQAMGPSEFVGETTSLVDGGGNLQIQVANGDDGSLTLLGLANATTGAACWTSDYAGVDATGCVPRFLGTADAFAASDCTGAPLVESDGCPVQAALLPDSNLCDDKKTLYSLGKAVDGSAYISYDLADCSQSDSAGPYYALGTPIPDSSLPALPVLTDGSGSLKGNHVGSTSGVLLRSKGLTLDGVPCIEFDTTAGKRCVPNATTFYENPGTYADATCTTPIFLVYDSSLDCAKTAPSYSYLGLNDSDSTTIYSVASTVTEGFYYHVISNGDCNQLAMNHQVFVTVGAPVDPTQFPELTLVTDP